jgi:hypothetical protein
MSAFLTITISFTTEPNKEEEDQVVFGPLLWEEKAPVLQDLDHGRVRTLMTGSFVVNVQVKWDQDAYLPADGNYFLSVVLDPICF